MPLEAMTVELVESRLECGDVWRFRLTKPAGYRFMPGQAMSLTLPTPSGDASRYFSHCDAPGDTETVVVTRATGSEFKDALLALRPGDPITMKGPIGRLTVPLGIAKVAFLVGGVGITPASSIVRDAVLTHSGLRCLVFYGNATTGCIPLRAEFDGYVATGVGIECVHVLSDADEQWTGERGRIDADLVRRHCDPLDGWHWLLSGAPGMVEAMRAMLTGSGVPAENVSFEGFGGY